MTSLPANRPSRRLGLVIDLDICVGCHACAVACKAWNTQTDGTVALADTDPYGAEPSGAWLNRIHSYEIEPADTGQGAEAARLIHFPKSCLHCEDAPCVTVCPTGASYKREEDGIVLVNEDACMGCGLCAWACPYGARELDPKAGVMKKCTLCVDRIYDETRPEEDRVPACVRACPAGARAFGDLADPNSEASRLSAARGGMDLMPEQGTKPVNRYLPPRSRDQGLPGPDTALGGALGGVDLAALCGPAPAPQRSPGEPAPRGFLGWLDRALERLETER
ncbi:MAG: 4Fe-4S dicluster domain-containing protein [Pseudomonadota bacterium]